ncbi:MAG: hypothetical protein QM711_16895 [Micropruina sp.]|uniref:hypothetical protein n=1 Tax=Micropruina sp. TaxID=2737536 RepID=UPI0039E59BF9
MAVSIDELAAELRGEFGLPRLVTLDELRAWLTDDLGGTPTQLSGEFLAGAVGASEQLIDTGALAFSLSWEGEVVRTTLASVDELEHLPPPDDEPLDLDDPTPEAIEVAGILRALESAERVLVLVEAADGAGRPTNFLTLGPGQLLTEKIWACTSVLPRSTGRPVSEPYRQACALREAVAR